MFFAEEHLSQDVQREVGDILQLVDNMYESSRFPYMWSEGVPADQFKVRQAKECYHAAEHMMGVATRKIKYSEEPGLF